MINGVRLLFIHRRSLEQAKPGSELRGVVYFYPHFGVNAVFTLQFNSRSPHMPFALWLIKDGLIDTLQGWEPSEDDKKGRRTTSPCPLPS